MSIAKKKAQLLRILNNDLPWLWGMGGPWILFKDTIVVEDVNSSHPAIRVQKQWKIWVYVRLNFIEDVFKLNHESDRTLSLQELLLKHFKMADLEMKHVMGLVVVLSEGEGRCIQAIRGDKKDGFSKFFALKKS